MGAITSMKFSISNEQIEKLDQILANLNQELAGLGRLNF
jgi:hypothetical protein